MVTMAGLLNIYINAYGVKSIIVIDRLIMDLKPGDILLTKNTDKVGNPTPGYWNHAAVVGRDNFVIEAQEEVPKLLPEGGIVKSNGYYFWERYPEILCLRYGQINISSAAEKYVGNPYRKIASVFMFMRKPTRGENCVSLIRRAYQDTTGEDPKWKFPDDIAKDPRLIQVGYKKDYEGWKEPDDWYKGVSI